MSAMIWHFTELLIFAIDVAGALWYLHRKLGTRGKPLPRFLIGGSLIFLVFAAGYFFAIPDSIRLPLLGAAIVGYALAAARGSTRQKVFHAFIACVILGLSDSIVIALLTLLPGVTFNMVIQQTMFRLQGMVVSKLLYLLLVFMLGRSRAVETHKTAYWVMLASVPMISIVIITIMICYEPMKGNEVSYSLISMTCGLFIINAALLLLHDRLAANTKLLVEKEKMLQQSELQNRHFNETLAATDNMLGFRHDMKNHLQVLSGYLEMNNPEKAREYLNEIGSFIRKNDFSINCGYPLVDAVLGSKVAIAKKLGIEVDYTILLNREINIEQLDLCSLLGNTMDNALEACERIQGQDVQRSIHIDLKSLEGATELTIANTVDTADAAQVDVLKTNKQGQGHGIGLAIVRRTVKKYKGTLDIAYAGTQFEVKIMIPAG